MMQGAYPAIWQLIGLMRNAPGLAGAVMRGGGPAGGVQQIPQMPGGGVPGAARPMGLQPGPQGTGHVMPSSSPNGAGGGIGSMPPVPYQGGGYGGITGGGGGGGMPPGPYAGNFPPLGGGQRVGISPQATAQMGLGAAQAGMNGQAPIPSLEQVLAGIKQLETPGANPDQSQRFRPMPAEQPWSNPYDMTGPDPAPYADPESMTGPNGPRGKTPSDPTGPKPKAAKPQGRPAPMPQPRPKGLLGDQNGQDEEMKKWLERNFWESTRRTGGGGGMGGGNR